MRVAICDDEIDSLEFLQSRLEQTGRADIIRGFLCAQQLQDAIAEGESFDLIFMDIEWNQPQNGIDIAAAVNEKCPETQIIFVTGHPDRFFQQIFLKPVNLCGYLDKPVDPEVLEKLLHKAVETLRSREQHQLLIQHKGVVHALPVFKICYIESRGHQLTVHMAQGNVVCYERLEKIKERLPDCFFQCHKSYLVNMDCIRRIEKNSILVKTGDELPVSKAKHAQTRAAFFRYMGETL